MIFFGEADSPLYLSLEIAKWYTLKKFQPKTGDHEIHIHYIEKSPPETCPYWGKLEYLISHLSDDWYPVRFITHTEYPIKDVKGDWNSLVPYLSKIVFNRYYFALSYLKQGQAICYWDSDISFLSYESSVDFFGFLDSLDKDYIWGCIELYSANTVSKYKMLSLGIPYHNNGFFVAHPESSGRVIKYFENVLIAQKDWIDLATKSYLSGVYDQDIHNYVSFLMSRTEIGDSVLRALPSSFNSRYIPVKGNGGIFESPVYFGDTGRGHVFCYHPYGTPKNDPVAFLLLFHVFRDTDPIIYSLLTRDLGIKDTKERYRIMVDEEGLPCFALDG